MKKLLTTLALLSSFSLACDLPFEEISGVKVGCPLSEQGIKIEGESTRFKVDFFDFVTITQADDQASKLVFYKEYKVNKNNLNSAMPNIKSDIKMLLQSLEDRWGYVNTSSQIDNILSLSDYSNVSNIGAGAEVNNLKSKITDNIQLLIYREVPSKSEDSPPVHLFLTYNFFDQSKREQMKGL